MTTPTASLRDATRTLLLFLGCANDAATSTPLSTSQYKCPMPHN
ncbi:MAG: hypothetical protein ACYTX0_55530 [Nostoc sp.]